MIQPINKNMEKQPTQNTAAQPLTDKQTWSLQEHIKITDLQTNVELVNKRG